ncbi:MAG: EamA family transporter [Anaerolineales bacterium]|nr:EamA family transporter [Anaerolineales bacterium]MCL4259251.1 EamA family transporter [Anaerolineales bacterium]
MSLFAISILLVSAIFHTAWNFLIKRAEDRYIVTFWMVVFGGACALIALFFTGLPPREMWGYAIASVCVEAAYFSALSYAYRDNDFSLVYPIARGAAPAFIALWSFLFLRERLTSGGGLGLALIIGGLIIIGANALMQAQTSRIHMRGVAIAFFIAFLISIYSTIDGSAVKHGHAVSYVMTMFALVPFALLPFVFQRYEWTRIRRVLLEQRVQIPLAGLLGVLAYLMAVLAYSISPLSYAGAVREISVVFGALVGWRLLNERLGKMRVFGAFVIFAGVLTIALYG